MIEEKRIERWLLVMANTAFKTEYVSLAACRNDLAMPFPVPAHMTRINQFVPLRILLCVLTKIRTCWYYTNRHLYRLFPICSLKNSVQYLRPKSRRAWETKSILICKIITTCFTFSCRFKDEWITGTICGITVTNRTKDAMPLSDKIILVRAILEGISADENGYQDNWKTTLTYEQRSTMFYLRAFFFLQF